MLQVSRIVFEITKMVNKLLNIGNIGNNVNDRTNG